MNSTRSFTFLAALFATGCSVEANLPEKGNAEITATPTGSAAVDTPKPSGEPAGAPKGNDSNAKPSGSESGVSKSGDEEAKPQTEAPKTAPLVGGCDGAPPPALPQMTSAIVFQSPPPPTGGDERGTWVATKSTMYLSPSSGPISTESRVAGTAFVRFDGERFLSVSNTQTKIAMALGEIERSEVTKIAGAYTYSAGGPSLFGSYMGLTLDCTHIEKDGTTPKTVAFSRISDTEALFHQTTDSALGEVTIVLKLKKVD